MLPLWVFCTPPLCPVRSALGILNKDIREVEQDKSRSQPSRVAAKFPSPIRTPLLSCKRSLAWAQRWAFW